MYEVAGSQTPAWYSGPACVTHYCAKILLVELIAIRRISPEACLGDYRDSYAGDRGANPQLSIGRVLWVEQDMRAAMDREIDNLAYLFRLPRQRYYFSVGTLPKIERWQKARKKRELRIAMTH